MQTVLVRDGVVVEVLKLVDGHDLADCFPEALLAAALQAPDAVALGWTYDGKAYAAPMPIVIDLRPYVAQVRYAKETAGIVVGTAAVATDRDSQSLITGMWAAAQINPDISVSFKSGSGFVTISADQIRKIVAAVANHVQACFSAEAQVVQGVAAGTIKTMADVDAAFAAVTA